MTERIEQVIGDTFARVFDAAEAGDSDAAALAAEEGIREALALEAATHVHDPQATVSGLQQALEAIGERLAGIEAAQKKARPGTAIGAPAGFRNTPKATVAKGKVRKTARKK